LEILLTLGQSLLGAFLLANMRFAWWESALLFLLWAVQFVLSGFERPLGADVPPSVITSQVAGWLSVAAQDVEIFAVRGKEVITALYFIWAGGLLALRLFKKQGFEALTTFPRLMREHW
jgi:hypothetical protein